MKKQDPLLSVITLIACAWLLATLSIFLFLPPDWALMDDASLVRAARSNFQSQTFWQYLITFIRGDFGWGMFRPLYGLYIYLFYRAFNNSSQAAYLFLYCLNIFIFALWAYLFHMSIDQVRSKEREGRKVRSAYYSVLFFLLCFLFTPHYNLFFFASLQERLLLLFSGFVYLGMFTLNTRANRATVLPVMMIWLGSVLSLCSKATAVFIIVPMVLWLLVLNRNFQNRKFLYLAVWLFVFGGAFSLFLLSIRGGYTSQYDINRVAGKFLGMGLRFYIPFLSGVFGVLLWVIQKYFRRRELSWESSCAWLVWPISLISYLLVMVPWGNVNGYYLVPAGVFWIGTMLICYRELVYDDIWRNLLLVGALCILSILAWNKFKLESLQHYGVRPVVKVLSAGLRSNPDKLLIRMPAACWEASDSLSYLIDAPGLVRRLEYGRDDIFWDAETSEMRKWIVVNKECPELPAQLSVKRTIFSLKPWYIYEVSTSDFLKNQ